LSHPPEETSLWRRTCDYLSQESSSQLKDDIYLDITWQVSADLKSDGTSAIRLVFLSLYLGREFSLIGNLMLKLKVGVWIVSYGVVVIF
jgi:hypothetical protein